jgi:DNA-binding NarL/FixJ family response regulator
MAHKAFTPARRDFRSEIHLLIVQRNELFARALARYLSAHYEKVLVATTATAAEGWLSTSNARFHVVCGQTLGLGDPDGVSCLVRWRAEFPNLARAVLATGAEGLPAIPSAIDGVFRKPSHTAELLELLQVSSFTAHPTQKPLLAALNPDSNENIMKTSKTQTKAHDLKTLKDRTAVATRPGAAPVSTAQGFTVI